MLKYQETMVTFSEVPEEVTLCINISNCPIRCKGCHSKHLWENVGEELKPVVLSDLIAKNNGITCIAFMGGDADVDAVVSLAKWVKSNTELKVAWYTGRSTQDNINHKYTYFDYVKTGPYIEELGGLDKPKSNQKFFKIIHKQTSEGTMYVILEDITYKFRHSEIKNKN